MNGEEFKRISNMQIEKCFKTLDSKASEYSVEHDRLHNFKIAAELQQCDPKKALSGMMAKHIVSIYDMCTSEGIYPSELWDEKINDTINYLLLLKALQVEEQECLVSESIKFDDMLEIRDFYAEN